MKAGDDRELRDWMDDWRATPAPAAEARAAILRHIRRRSLTLMLVMGGELVLTLLLLAMLGAVLTRAREPETFGVVVAGGILAVVALALAAWNRRGIWRPSAETTEAFLGLSLLRCRRSLRAVRYAYGIMFAEALILVPWLLISIRRHPDRRPLGWDPHLYYGTLLAIVFGAATLGCLWYARRVRREREALLSARRELAS